MPSGQREPTIPDGDLRLKGLRGLRGFKSAAAAATRLGVLNPATWEDIESPGRGRELRFSEAMAIAAAAGMQPSFFTSPIERLGDVGEG